MAVTAAIQYISTSVQSFGSQGYYNKCLITKLRLLMYSEETIIHFIHVCSFSQNSAKMSRHGQNGLSFVPKTDAYMGALGSQG